MNIELSECPKLKDLHLQDNSIQDRRLVKVINQCSTKAVLDYIATRSKKGKAGKKGGKKGRGRKVSEGADDEVSSDQASAQVFSQVVRVLHSEEFKVVSQPNVKVVRPYIVCAVVRNLNLVDMDALKKFINIQTKLHESVCDQRTAATIATHDLASLAFPLEYEACPPGDIQLVPLGRHKELTAEQLITDLRAEAMKQKQKTKRNPFKSGLFKYLSLIEGAESYAVLRDSSKAVVSLPPVTNCDKSKITAKKINVLVEVTSPVSLETCKTVMDSVIMMMLEVGLFSEANSLVDDEEYATSSTNQELVIEQVRVFGNDGQLRVVYPSRVDLQLESVKVIHPEKV
ncbi:Leucine-rich repeat-containing protein 47 [Stylophora pistillata]|uniref:Leucine-rich repeat-containing protein 47 n=1 Tax=Stylophora pistillata TaxID=50429 RepID=A0A2B4S8U5_STYPI|nr:Leucine-rich repeat-containing protein 47 [Stylophora pistillata]